MISPAPLSSPLTGSDLHVWCAALSGSPQKLTHYSSLLSPDETARANRFYFERDRHRYIFGRGILRILLSSYLGKEASRITFLYGQHGKPAIEAPLHFNLAHSNDWAVFVFVRDSEIGIDIEHIRPLQDADDFARQFFTTNESAWINSLPHDQKWNGFYKLWTCKEAYLKANGSGLTVPLNQAEISFSKNDTAKLTSIGGDVKEASKWRLELFKPVEGYQAALAIERYDGPVTFLTYQ
ncbi:MAG: 4'-phosphopantetheinyl transferase superfamily protein [Chloroflexi bacterium]|nr:4'-phosphopantetheinyl transferase superfamily protein [Chloroflexota bacterium]